MHEIVKSKSESAFGDASSFARNDSNLSLFREAGGSSATTATARDGETFLDSGPITDIKVLFSGERTPPGYRKVCHVGSDKNADVNRRGPGKGVYVCFRRGGTMLPVTGICVVRESESEFVPPGYTMIEKTATGSYFADLCGGATGERAFLCFCRGESPPITNIAVVYPHLGSRCRQATPCWSARQ